MTSGQHQEQPERRLSPADLHHVQFARGSMLRPGYVEAEVDRLMSRAAEELARLIAEKAQLRDEVAVLRRQVEEVEGAVQQPPSEQAVRILASAQQTADNYVAEAEEFSRQVTSEARAEYEELVRRARENAGAIIQAAQEAAEKMGRAPASAADAAGRSVEELQEQVAYLKAFGQSVRVQLRSYLEALISDVETQWGRADPALLPQDVARPPAQRSVQEPAGVSGTTFVGNTAAASPREEGLQDDASDDQPATAGSRSSR
jgi:DivIVA domain-containing protein